MGVHTEPPLHEVSRCCLPRWIRVTSFIHLLYWIALCIGGGAFTWNIVCLVSLFLGDDFTDLDMWDILWDFIEITIMLFSNPIFIFLYLLQQFSDKGSSGNRLKHESEKLQNLYEVYDNRLEELLKDLRQGELDEVKNNFEGAKEQFKRFLGPWTRIMSRKDNSTPASLIDTWPDGDLKEGVVDGFRTVCKVWASALADAQPGSRADESLGLDTARGVADILERARTWESQLEFKFAVMQSGYNNSQETSWRQIHCGNHAQRRPESEFSDTSRELLFSRVKCCGCYQTELPNRSELCFCRLHLVYHLGVQLILGIAFAAAHVIRLFPLMQNLDPEDEKQKKICALAALGGIMWLIYACCVITVMVTLKHISLVVSLRELESQHANLKTIEARISSVKEHAMWTATLARWRGSTLPRLDIIDWAQRKFREAPAVVDVFTVAGHKNLTNPDYQDMLACIVNRFAGVLSALTPEAISDAFHRSIYANYLNDNFIDLMGFDSAGELAELRTRIRRDFDAGADIFCDDGPVHRLLSAVGPGQQLTIADLHKIVPAVQGGNPKKLRTTNSWNRGSVDRDSGGNARPENRRGEKLALQDTSRASSQSTRATNPGNSRNEGSFHRQESSRNSTPNVTPRTTPRGHRG